ncbi:MAG: hypothetical protein HY401_03860 [Elusimicrobia bacterium]|nr:hypothetical protein [Elusimicrobiota bacterium]
MKLKRSLYVLPLLAPFLLHAGQGVGDLKNRADELFYQDQPAAAEKPLDNFKEGAVGILLMAHGGSPQWDQAVREAARPLRQKVPIDIAYGMADPATIQAAILKLESLGVRKVAVVRLFISGDSFKERTEKILGLKPGATAKPKDSDVSGHDEGHDHQGHDPDKMPLWRVETKSSFVMSEEGLMDDPWRMGEIVADRVAGLAKNPSLESVILIGHGPAGDEENAKWLRQMTIVANQIRSTRHFRNVRVETLREDWPEQRKSAEERIQRFVNEARDSGGIAIVVPFRLFGFGPYAQVLEGIEYRADGKGLLPDPRITKWIENQAGKSFAEKNWDNPLTR